MIAHHLAAILILILPDGWIYRAVTYDSVCGWLWTDGLESGQIYLNVFLWDMMAESHTADGWADEWMQRCVNILSGTDGLDGWGGRKDSWWSNGTLLFVRVQPGATCSLKGLGAVPWNKNHGFIEREREICFYWHEWHLLFRFSFLSALYLSFIHRNSTFRRRGRTVMILLVGHNGKESTQQHGGGKKNRKYLPQSSSSDEIKW